METSAGAQNRRRWRDKVSSLIRRQCRTGDGVSVTVWAYMRGTRPSKPSWEVFVPSAFGLVWVVLVLLRYRLVYRGQWVIELQRSDSDHVPICSVVAHNRATAAATIEEVAARLPATNLDSVPSVFAALRADGFRLKSL